MIHSKGQYLSRRCQCPDCRDAWRRWHLAYRHRTNPGPHYCLICDASFPTVVGRDRHELYLHDRTEKRTA